MDSQLDTLTIDLAPESSEVRDMFKKIPLTQGQFAKVSHEDFAEQSQYKWCAAWSKKTKSYYAVRAIWDKVLKKTKPIKMHREIMQTPKGMDCDHIDHDTLNCQRDNLRNVSRSHNAMNRKGANSNSTTGIRGVSPFRNGFIVKINDPKTGKEIYLGTYSDKAVATEVRKSAEKKYYGEYSNEVSHG
jgi:hypothetical protein